MGEGKRKGAVRMADIPADVMLGLNEGRLETATLAEWLAVDYRALMQKVAPEVGQEWLTPLAKGNAILARNRHAGLALATTYPKDAVERFGTHPSDTVRGWACFALGHRKFTRIGKRIEAFKPFAKDPHFGVRELAWLALRPDLARDLEEAIAALTNWTQSEDENVRRFASESTRPRGVWCEHIPALKEKPEMAAGILEPLKSDPSRYVQNSVANWINDAGKSRPDWAKAVIARWTKESKTKETAYVVKRAGRGEVRSKK